MDDRRFDDLTRFVGRRASRRAVLKGAIAAGVAAVFGGGVAEASTPSRGGVYFRIKSFCTPAGYACRNTLNPTRRCCYRCNSRTGKCCETYGYSCRYDSDCCDGRVCRDPNLLDDEVVSGCFNAGDLPFGAECIDNSECESDNCVEGICCTQEQTCGQGSTCCSPDETCLFELCCPLDNVCVVDVYDPSQDECCDPYIEACTVDGCCPLEQACYDALSGTTLCCDGYQEFCLFIQATGQSICTIT